MLKGLGAIAIAGGLAWDLCGSSGWKMTTARPRACCPRAYSPCFSPPSSTSGGAADSVFLSL